MDFLFFMDFLYEQSFQNQLNDLRLNLTGHLICYTQSLRVTQGLIAVLFDKDVKNQSLPFSRILSASKVLFLQELP